MAADAGVPDGAATRGDLEARGLRHVAVQRPRRPMIMTRRIATAVVALALAAQLPSADAASLEDVRERGMFAVCAHPDALPYSSQERAVPGFQIELGEAIAKQLGVRFRTEWIVFTRHARRVDCDATIGSIIKDED